MSRTLIIAALTALVAAPVAGAENPAQTAPASGNRAVAKSDAKKYCLTVEPLTGSRVEKKECKTKRQWAWEGIKVDGQ